jgi:hypothetical protein
MEHGGKFGTAEQSKTTFEAIFLMLNTKKAAELKLESKTQIKGPKTVFSLKISRRTFHEMVWGHPVEVIWTF